MSALSICILTYNRAKYLPELLESIIAQDREDLEVVLSDDASTDDTHAVAASYAPRIKNFRYLRHPNNLGLDRNFLAAVEAASGEYCWLMGDDDRLEPGGVMRVLEALTLWPNVGGLTVGVLDYDATMERCIGRRPMPPTSLLYGNETVITDLADLIGFMSAMIVRRDAWMRVAGDPTVAQFHNLYVHVYMMGRIVRDLGTWGVVAEPCVGFRTENDQFLSASTWRRRLTIDIVGYDEISNGLFPSNYGARRAIRQRIFNTHILSRVRSSKDKPGTDQQNLSTAGQLIAYYWDLPALWLRGLPRILTPRPIIRLARNAYHCVRRSDSGANRDLDPAK